MVRTTSIGLDAAIDMRRKPKAFCGRFPGGPHVFPHRHGGSGDRSHGCERRWHVRLFTPQDKWRKINGRTITKEELANLISEVLGRKVPGQAALFMQPIEMRLNELLEGTRADVGGKVFSSDYDILEKSAKGNPRHSRRNSWRGGRGLRCPRQSAGAGYYVEPDELEQIQLSRGKVNNAIATGLGGKTVGTIVEGNQRFNIVVRMPEASRVEN